MKIEDYSDLINLWKKAGLPCRQAGRDTVAHISRELQRDHERFFLADYRGDIVGSVLVTHDGRKGWINRLAVLPEYRNHGIGQTLVTRSENWLKKNGIMVIACLIEHWNRYSGDFFSKLGYTRHDDITYFTKKERPDV